MQRSASCKRGAASSTPSPARDIVVNIEGTGIGTNRKRNANFLTPSKAVILVGFLVLGLTMYLTQSYLDARSALMDREYLIHEKMKRLQVELQTMKHEVDTTKEALMERDRVIKAQEEDLTRVHQSGKREEKEEVEVGSMASQPQDLSNNDTTNENFISKSHTGKVAVGHMWLPALEAPKVGFGIHQGTATIVANGSNIADSTLPYLESEIGKQWKQPAFNAAVAAKARGGDTLIENDPRSEKRKQAVRRAMKHAWSGYRKYAWGSDELEPITKRGVNEFGHTGVTVIDAIDTLWIMDLKEEYNEAREYLKDYPNKLSADTLSVFECTIRVLGGFMSTYYLTGDRLFLENAKLVGDRLLPAFHHSGKKEHPQWKINDIGMPKGHVSLKTMHTHHPQWQHGRVMLSEFGTNLLEFNALSRETGNMKYAEAAAKPLRAIHEKYPKKGLLPSYFLPNGKLSSRQLPSSSTILSPPSLPLRTDFDSMQV